MIAVMRVIYKLSDYSGNIYSHLTSDMFKTFLQSETSSFIKTQLEEESLKSELILADSELENEIIQYEKHALFQGNINFLLLNTSNRIELKHKFSIANIMFDSRGSNGKFANDHLLMRAVIASIKNWEVLQEFNMTDSLDNWQLLLRRNVFIQNLISNWCNNKSAEAVLKELDKIIKTNSQIDGSSSDTNAKEISVHVHNQLYQDNLFHEWMQNKGAIKLKWSNNFLYVHRPRSWYDWVALNTHRNEIAALLSQEHALLSNNRCDASNFFWGSKLELYKTFSDYTVSVEFNESNNLKIGVKNGNVLESKKITYNQNVLQENDWLLCINYNYGDVNTKNEIENLLKKIDFEIFDLKNKDSLINCIAQ